MPLRTASDDLNAKGGGGLKKHGLEALAIGFFPLIGQASQITQLFAKLGNPFPAVSQLFGNLISSFRFCVLLSFSVSLLYTHVGTKSRGFAKVFQKFFRAFHHIDCPLVKLSAFCSHSLSPPGNILITYDRLRKTNGFQKKICDLSKKVLTFQNAWRIL